MHYHCRYRYYGKGLDYYFKRKLVKFLEKYKDQMAGYNFMMFEDQEWLIFKFTSETAKLNYFEKYWRSKERQDLGEEINNKPWNPRPWNMLPPGDFYKRQMMIMKNNNPEVFTYDSG